MVWVIIALVIWLVFLSTIVFVMRNHYKRLVEVSGKKDLESILEKILDRLEIDRINIEKINKKIDKLDREGEVHIQKVGLVRFNPFPETGGDQSFVLALLDKNDDGIVISSLHARATTRWYAKTIIKGKGKDIELSKEEEKAIIKTGKNNYQKFI